MVTVWLSALSFILLIPLSLSRFPGSIPDEGDIRDIYPTVTVAVGLSDHAHVLPYLLGWLENIEYPKKQIHLSIYLNGKEDSTADQIVWWQSSVKNLFRSFSVKSDIENWLEDGLRSARIRKDQRVFLLPGDALPRNERILQGMDSKNVATVPYFHAPPFREGGNIKEETWLDKEETSIILHSLLPLYINLEQMDSSYLTFDANNVMYYKGPDSPLGAFDASAANMKIQVHGNNSQFNGFWIDPEQSLDEKRWMVRYLAADWVADQGVHSIIPSRSVRPFIGDEGEKLGVDEIYLINLERRPERLMKVDQIMRILGIEYTHWKATDGKKLPKEYPYKILPGYIDPYHKRPIKAGEIGCFLSHYRIWEDVIARGLKRVIVFEDDVRFVSGGLQVLQELLEDIEENEEEWDLIYLGRKKNADQNEVWVPLHRRLSTVGYSYWTLGYLLSASGARKLIEAKPLDKLLPVDEYLPIMFDRHPNTEWSKHFEKRDLKAFTVYPLVVVPQRYVDQEGHVSDTEESIIVDGSTVDGARDEL